MIKERAIFGEKRNLSSRKNNFSLSSLCFKVLNHHMKINAAVPRETGVIGAQLSDKRGMGWGLSGTRTGGGNKTHLSAPHTPQAASGLGPRDHLNQNRPAARAEEQPKSKDDSLFYTGYTKNKFCYTNKITC